jgi:hypothetical protein
MHRLMCHARLPKTARSRPFKQDDRGGDKPSHGRFGSIDLF